MLPIPKDKTDPLRCFICGKSFEKEKSTRRHQFYCRSRVLSAAPSAPRKRSCQACTVAKTRCVLRGSRCTRCETRGITCEFRPAKSDAQRELRVRLRIGGIFDGQSGSPENVAILPREDELPDSAMVTFPQPNSTSSPIDWSDPSLTFNMSTPLTGSETSYQQFITDAPQPTQVPILYPRSLLAPQPEPAENTPLVEPGYEICNRTPTTQSFLKLTTASSLFASSSESGILRAFDLKRSKTESISPNAAILLKILCSYPDMMLRRQTFPPFIHPQCTSGPNANEPLPAPLVKCMEIAWTFKMRHTFSKNAFWVWREIRRENERLWEGRHSNDKFELLASLQSLMIYSIMRVIEGEADYTDFDDLLLVSMNAVHSRLRDLCTDELIHPSEFIGPPALTWKEWIFAESRRRTIATYRILSLLVCLETVVPCKSLPGLIHAPLPAKKTVWDAQDEGAWRREFDLAMAERGGRRWLTNGDLIRAQIGGGDGDGDGEGVLEGIGGGEAGGRQDANEALPSGWAEWYAGVDGLGTMILIAAAL